MRKSPDPQVAFYYFNENTGVRRPGNAVAVDFAVHFLPFGKKGPLFREAKKRAGKNHEAPDEEEI